MKSFFKVLFALCVALLWYLIAGSGSEGVSFIFFFVILFAFFIKPFEKKDSEIREQYLEKLKENAKKSQEINEQFSREKNTTYKDFRKKEKA